MGKSKELATLTDAGASISGNLQIDTGSGYNILQIGADNSTGYHLVNELNGLNIFQGAVGAGSKHLGIDSSGRVTMPYQPSFNIYQSGPWSLTAGVWGQNVNLDTARHNVGNHFNTSNGSFTAPISGKYLLTYISHFNSSTPSYFYSGIQINGGFEVYLFGYNAAVSGGDNTFGGSTILHINANDVVTFWNYDGDGGTIGHGYQRTHASGHLIG